jgi:predicted transcriptional regulator
MFAKELISGSVAPLKITDNGETALNWMDEYKLTHLPVVDNGRYIGLLSEADIYSKNDFTQPLENYNFSLGLLYVQQYQHVYDVLLPFDTHKLTLLPVVDDKNQYLGSITLMNLVNYFSRFSSVKNPGGIIVLELNTNDYLLTQIAQIVESNDAKILSLYISSFDDSTRMEITLKVNKMDIRAILQTFNRYNYNIKASFSEDDVNDDLRERFDSLMRYLDT